MLNGLKVSEGDSVRFTMFSNWTYEENEIYVIESVGKICPDGWFNIKLEGKKDWACCMHFSKVNKAKGV